MARDDRLKKVQGAGADFLDTARAKAEEFLKELSRAGGDTQGRAQGAFDDLLTGGRKSTEQFVTAIRKEVQNQLSALGLATKADLQALERRLSGRVTAAETSAARSAAAASARPAKAAGTAAKSTGAAGAAAKSTGAAKRSTASKSTATRTTAKKAAKKTAG
jgi:polyhydroxyalkanoate synthesis regulator phasin